MIFLMILACGESDKNSGTDTIDLSPMPACDTVTNSNNEEQPIPGATSYFLGDYTISGTDVSGTETWALISNPTWEATDEGGDCEVVWNVVGSTNDPQSCAACDLGVSIAATVDQGATTCPQGLWVDESEFQVSYDILRSGDGSATWYFASSGNTLGTGSHSGDNVSFVTDAECMFF